jgi:uncharacterized protein (DUF3820 family)
MLINWDFKIPFGKYIGKTILEISEIDPKYILWLHNEKIYEFDINLLQSCRIESINVDIDVDIRPSPNIYKI